MNGNKTDTTEQLILSSATSLFLERGYSGTKTTDIAELAGVNHSMLHYYYRTKLQLFKVVFKQQVQNLAMSISTPLLMNGCLEDVLEEVLRKHFYFFVDHPHLVRFIINEVNNNVVAKEVWEESVKDIFQPTIERMLEFFHAEFQKMGIEIKNILQFLITLMSLNLFVFLADPLLSKLLEAKNIDHKHFLEERIEENVRIAMLLISQKDKLATI